MVAARAMAGFALQLASAERRCGVVRVRMPGAKYRQHHLIVMALKAGVSALAAVVILGRRRGGGDGRQDQRRYRKVPRN
jgi:hypothetical protein